MAQKTQTRKRPSSSVAPGRRKSCHFCKDKVQEVDYKNVTMTGWMETNWPAHMGGVPGETGAIKTVDTAWARVLNAYNDSSSTSRALPFPLPEGDGNTIA